MTLNSEIPIKSGPQSESWHWNSIVWKSEISEKSVYRIHDEKNIKTAFEQKTKIKWKKGEF
jgi:hypothetical protein